MSKIEDTDTMFISAKDKLNFDDFKNKLYDKIKKLHQVRYPYNNFLY